MKLVLLFGLIVLSYVTYAADPSLGGYTVANLLSTGNWTSISPPAVDTGGCPPKHRLCKRFLNAKKIELQNEPPSVNFALFESNPDGSNKQLRYSVHLNGTQGVKRIHARTGPRSRGDKNLQQAFVACPFVPELQIELDPKGGDIKLLENVFMEVVVYFTKCDVDLLGGESLVDNVVVGHENKFTRQMVMTKLIDYPAKYNTNLYGEMALYVGLNQVTPGNNNFLITRGDRATSATFNSMQGNSDESMFQSSVWQYPIHLIIAFLILLTLIFSAVAFFNSDKSVSATLAEVRSLASQNALMIKLLYNTTNTPLPDEFHSTKVHRRPGKTSNRATIDYQ